jgi:23S rRNA pseudouridine1911/1915/1917 synthase
MNDIKIIYEDENIVVLDKPAGITVNKSDTTKDEYTVADWVLEKVKDQKSKIKDDDETDFSSRAGIVHRIDKETSGILLVAKNLKSFENLQAQFKERKVNKTYIALVHGAVSPQQGEIVVPVGRLPWNRKRFGVLAGGREAMTYYSVISIINHRISYKKYEDLTLLELKPKTGRTHQIRVHLKYFNHPIYGDSLYAGRKTSRDDRRVLNRFFLHAQKITFLNPNSGKEMSFESPLPYELKQMLEYLKH